jgi:hypothetical protein
MAKPHLRTKHNYDAFEVVSALQKCIRRGLEEDALYWAYELAELPSNNYYSWLWARLKVIACEDVGPANPLMPLLIDVLWRNWKEKKGERLWYTNAVVALVRSPKSRIVDNALNMQLSEDELGWRRDKPIPYEEDEPIPPGSVGESKLENPATPIDFARKIPPFAMDMHTPAGKQYGLGKKDFYQSGAVLANKALDDPYEERAKAGDLELEKQKEKENRWK